LSGRVGEWPTLSRCAFVVPTIHGAPTRIIQLDHSSESCPSLCGCPILRRFCEGWVFSVLVLVLVLVSVSVSVLVPRSTSNPPTVRRPQTLLPTLIRPVTAPRVVSFSASKTVNPIPPFANPAKDGAPAGAKTELRSNLPEWYHPLGSAVNCGNHGYVADKGGPPASRELGGVCGQQYRRQYWMGRWPRRDFRCCLGVCWWSRGGGAGRREGCH